MMPFGEAKSISGHQTLQLMRRPYGVKGSMYFVTLPAFQRCVEDELDVAEQRFGSEFPTDHVLLEDSKPRPSIIGENVDPHLGIYKRYASDGSLFDSYCSTEKHIKIEVTNTHFELPRP
ncbi:unnamed protein product [Ilex paraguariensis]|uniref:Uncharacterized protein n=1 Tax=Ilex paraguariensis TaxID=185542 RepID=A0ABC8TN75_9AQUA